MSATIIDGKALADKVKAELKIKVEKFKAEYKKDVTLAVVLVGNNPASQVYVRNKIKACEVVGIKSLSFCLPETSTQSQVEETVLALANDEKVDAIIVQLPLPKGLDSEKVMALIPSSKDVDGFHPENQGKLLMAKPETVACTPFGVMKMIESVGYDLCGKKAAVIGRSNIVGKPMACLLQNADATVTVCHSRTKNLKEIVKESDVVIAAIGKPKFVTADMVKDGAIVIDVGINRCEDGKLVGDVDFESVKEVAGYLSPVPGGVGPMTIAMLMENAYQIALKKALNV